MTPCLADIVRFYESLSPESLDALSTLYADDARFEDPFNAVTGLAAIERIFRDMFERLDAPHFEITRSFGQERDAMLTWTFRFSLRGRVMEIRGATHLVFGDDGRVVLHKDYWDAAGELYAKLPMIGSLMRWLSGRLSAAPAARSIQV